MYPCFTHTPLVESVPAGLLAGVDRRLGQDGDMWDWFTPDSRDAATEVTYPTRLVQQIESEEEMAHDYLDTRVKNSTGEASVSCHTEKKSTCFTHVYSCVYSPPESLCCV